MDKTKMSKEKLHCWSCHYSDLPSPMDYLKGDHIDYDGMGNQGRIPNIKQKKKFSIKQILKKIKNLTLTA